MSEIRGGMVHETRIRKSIAVTSFAAFTGLGLLTLPSEARAQGTNIVNFRLASVRLPSAHDVDHDFQIDVIVNDTAEQRLRFICDTGSGGVGGMSPFSGCLQGIE